MTTYCIYLGTESDWCTVYSADTLPDFCAIQAAYPAITVWDVHQLGAQPWLGSRPWRDPSPAGGAA